jgi:hypothetical protein
MHADTFQRLAVHAGDVVRKAVDTDATIRLAVDGGSDTECIAADPGPGGGDSVDANAELGMPVDGLAADTVRSYAQDSAAGVVRDPSLRRRSVRGPEDERTAVGGSDWERSGDRVRDGHRGRGDGGGEQGAAGTRGGRVKRHRRLLAPNGGQDS